MQRYRVPIQSLMAVALVALLTASASWAADSCRDEAKQNFRDCKAQCKEDFQAAKDACLNRDHTCVEVCRANRYDCRLATGFDAAIDACNAQLAQAKQDCRNDPNNPPGSPELDHCIDQAQVVAFQCRDQAREDAKLPLKACRKQFVACAQACPPAPSGAPADPAQCRVDAKNAYVACKTVCVEDVQVARDACRHRDHACVEQCRADRDACVQPVKAQLDSDIASCNATRDSDVATCRSLYGPDSSNPDPVALDQCIDNAQVTAFECRDQARENARPGFEACRQQFRDCAQACPPA